MTSQSLLEVTSRHGGVVRVWRATARAILLYLRGDRSREGVWAEWSMIDMSWSDGHLIVAIPTDL